MGSRGLPRASLWGSLGLSWGSLGRLLGLSWGSFGFPWQFMWSFGFSWGSLGLHLVACRSFRNPRPRVDHFALLLCEDSKVLNWLGMTSRLESVLKPLGILSPLFQDEIQRLLLVLLLQLLITTITSTTAITPGRQGHGKMARNDLFIFVTYGPPSWIQLHQLPP